MNLGTQMYNLHKWYMRMSSDETNMFGVKYRDHDFFRGDDDFWVDFELTSHIPSTSPRRLYHHHLGSISINNI